MNTRHVKQYKHLTVFVSPLWHLETTFRSKRKNQFLFIRRLHIRVKCFNSLTKVNIINFDNDHNILH